MRKLLLFILLCLTQLSSAYCQIEEWIYTYDGGSNNWESLFCITMDNKGFVYACGQIRQEHGWNSYKDIDFLTIKLSSDGDSAWTRTYNGSGNQLDRASAIKVDNDGNVYVAGYAWVDSISKNDLCLLKYNTDGTLLWDRLYNTTNSDNDYAYDLTLDSAGNSYIAGYSYSYDTTFGGQADSLLLVKHDENGNLVWKRNYFGPGQTLNSTVKVLTTAEQEIILCAAMKDTTWTSSTNVDIITRKVSLEGDLIWESKYNNSDANSSDYPSDVKVDSAGNVFLGGMSWGAGTLWDYLVLKYNKDGEEQWNSRFNGDRNDMDLCEAIDITSNGGVVLTGSSDHIYYDDIVTVMFDSLGNQKWVSWVNSDGATSDDRGLDVVCNSTGQIYVSGVISTQEQFMNMIVLKYDELGNQIWKTDYDGTDTNSGTEYGYAMCVDDEDNVYVAGWLDNDPTEYDAVVIKFSWNNTGVINYADNTEVLKIFPNPTQSNGIVSVAGANEEFEIVLYNVQGAEVYKTSTSDGKIVLPDLPTGMYNLKIKTSINILSTKLLIY